MCLSLKPCVSHLCRLSKMDAPSKICGHLTNFFYGSLENRGGTPWHKLPHSPYSDYGVQKKKKGVVGQSTIGPWPKKFGLGLPTPFTLLCILPACLPACLFLGFWILPGDLDYPPRILTVPLFWPLPGLYSQDGGLVSLPLFGLSLFQTTAVLCNVFVFLHFSCEARVLFVMN